MALISPSRRTVITLASDLKDLLKYSTCYFLEEPTRRVALSSVPMSGNWLFGPSDVDELLFILQDSPFNFSDESTALSQAQMARFRPSRVRAMFASRACRKAVMVGDPLTSSQMKKLVTQLGDLEQPWVR